MAANPSRLLDRTPATGHVGDPDDMVVCGVIACDSAGTITAFSPEAQIFTRLKTADALGRRVAILPAALRKIISQVRAGKTAITRQVKLPGPMTLRVRASALSVKGRKPGAVLLLEDLAAARRLQQNIARLDRLANIGTLSASLAHEIKNGMVAIKTFVDLLLEKNQDSELAEVVSRELKRVEILTNQMLRAANPARAGIAPIPVHELLDHSLRLVQHQIDEKLITLRRSFKASPDIIVGSGYQLEQVFMNLLLNALEAMGPNGELTVQTESVPATGRKPAQLCLIFSDTGIGIPAENLARVFDTFFTTKRNGTGLGLAITRRIVREHHGEVFVESRPKQGSTFRLLLPLAAT